MELIPLFNKRGLRVAVVKHAHHSLEPDQPSKDSMRLREAGASQMLVASRHRAVLFNEYPERSEEPTLTETLEILPLSDLDLVLVEGFKREAIPKIELHRPELGHPLMFPDDPNIIAIATAAKEKLSSPLKIPVLPIDRPSQVADFIMEQFVSR